MNDEELYDERDKERRGRETASLPRPSYCQSALLIPLNLQCVIAPRKVRVRLVKSTVRDDADIAPFEA